MKSGDDAVGLGYKADKALYQAKAKGGDTLVHAD